MFIYNVGLLRNWKKKALIRLCLNSLLLASLLVVADDQNSKPSLTRTRERISAAVSENRPLDDNTTLAELDVLIASDSSTAVRDEARVMRTMLHSRAGRYEEAFRELEEIFQRTDSRLYVDVPVVTVGTESHPAGRQLVRRPAVELFIHACVNVAQSGNGPLQMAKLRQALPYFELALDVNRKALHQDSRNDLGPTLKQDRKLINLLVAAPYPQKVNHLVDALFVIDQATGTIEVRDSVAAGMALTHLAELVHEKGVDGVAQVGELRFGPIELVQMAISLPSTSRPVHRRGIWVLKQCYQAAGATQMVAQLENSTPEPQGSHSFKVCRDAIDALLKNEPAAALMLVKNAEPSLVTELALLREHGDPARLHSVSVRPARHPLNLTDEGPVRVELSPVAAKVQRQQMYAIEALARWHLAESRGDEGLPECEQALLIGAELDGMLRSSLPPIASQDPAADLLPLQYCLACYFAETENISEEQRELVEQLGGRLKSFAKIVARCSTSGLVAGHLGTPAQAMENLQLVNSHPVLSNCAMVRRNLVRALVRHGMLRQAKESFDLLDRLEVRLNAALHPSTSILKAELQRRSGETAGALFSEQQALDSWRRRLAVAQPLVDDIHSALHSLTHLVSKEYRTQMLSLLAPLVAQEHMAHRRYLIAVVFGLQDGRVPELDEQLATMLMECRAHGSGQVDEWERLLGAMVRHGGPKSLEQLTTIFRQSCLPPAPAQSPVPEKPVHPLGPVARYELFRELSEVVAYLDIETAAQMAADFLKASPEFASVPRPNAHRRQSAVNVPFDQTSPLRGICDDGLFAHIVPETEVLPGAEWAQWLAAQTPMSASPAAQRAANVKPAEEHAAAHRAIDAAIQDALNSFEASSDAALIHDRFLIAADLVLRTWPIDANNKPWHETTDPQVVRNACQNLLSVRLPENSPAEMSESLAYAIPALKYLQASVSLAVLDVTSARTDLAELEALATRRDQRLKLLQTRVATTPEHHVSAAEARLNRLLNAGFAVPYLPHPLTLKEAIAWCELLDRNAAPDRYSGHLALLANSHAFQATSLQAGLNSLQFFDAHTIPLNDNISGLKDVVLNLHQLATSGLIPYETSAQSREASAHNEAAKEKNLRPADLSLEPRRKALRSQQIGIRVPVCLNPATKHWVVPEQVLVLQMSAWDARAERIGDAHEAWFVHSRRKSQPQIAYMQHVIDEIDRVRKTHRFPWTIPTAPVAGAIYASENDQGVTAFVNGQFDKAEKLFLTATQHELKGGLNARRVMEGVGRASQVKHSWPHFSLMGTEGLPIAPQLGFDDLAYGLQAHRNLAMCYYLTGKFDEALATIVKIREVEARTGHSRHHDPLFAPLDLQALFAREARPLCDAADSIASAMSSLAKNEFLTAAATLDGLPLEFASSRIARHLRVRVQVMNYTAAKQARLANAGKDQAVPGSPPNVESLLAEMEQTVVALQQKKLQGPAQFQMNPAWLFLQADVVLEQQQQQGFANSPGNIDPYRVKGAMMLREGLKQMVALQAAPVPPEGLPEWVTTYLAEAPHIVATNRQLFQAREGQPALVPDLMDTYHQLIRSACAPTSPIEWTTAVLQPLAVGDASQFEHLLVTCLPATPPALDALAVPGRYNISRLDWLLAALVRAAERNPQSQIRNFLIQRCEAYPLGSDASFAVLDALHALDPARAARASLQRLRALPPEGMEAVLASRNLHVVRRQGVLHRGMIGSPTAHWYADSMAFWFYPQEEPDTTVGERLFAVLWGLRNNPHDLAMLMPELEGLIRLERLQPIVLNRLVAPASCRFHAQLAQLLHETSSPAALALLLRYNDCAPPLTPGTPVEVQLTSGRTLAGTIVKEDATTWSIANADPQKPEVAIEVEKSGTTIRPAPGVVALCDAMRVARDQDYQSLAIAPWLADRPGIDTWKGQLGPNAWEIIKKSLPKVLEINDPAPDSAFVGELIAAAEGDVKRGVSSPIIKTTRDNAVAGRIYNELVQKVLLNRQLKPVLNLPAATNITTFQAALDHATETVRQVLRAEPGFLKDEKGNPVDPQDAPALAKVEAATLARAQYIVNHEVQQFTIRLWTVATHYAATGESLRGCSLSEINSRYIEAIEKLRVNTKFVHSTVVGEEIKGETNEEQYGDGLTLVGRRLYLPDNPEFARYVETYEYRKKDQEKAIVELRGPIPYSFYVALKEEPRLLDVLEISLAHRSALLSSPVGAVRLSLEVALAAPHVAWPVLMQDQGHSSLNAYLMMSAREFFPTTAHEFMLLVAPDTLASVDVLQRKQAHEDRLRRLGQAQFNLAFAAQTLARAPGIRDQFYKTFWGIRIATHDNENKKTLMRISEAGRVEAVATRQQLKAFDLFNLCDPADPPRYATVTETVVDKDGQNWTCKYRIITVLGNEIIYERHGKVAELPDVCRYLISVNPGIAKKLSLDLGMLTADPEMQIFLALKATSAIEAEVIPQMHGKGLTATEMRIAIGFPQSQFAGKDQAFLEAKQKLYYELAVKAFPERQLDLNDATVNPKLQKLVEEVRNWKQDIQNKAVGHANRIADEIIAASHDINSFGIIPGVIAVDFQNGRCVGFQAMVTVTFDESKPNFHLGYQPNAWHDSRPTISIDKVDGKQVFDSRVGIELPKSSN